MSKTAVVFWSGTGNTEEMANAVLEGMKENGADASIYSADAFQAGDVEGYDAIAFGCRQWVQKFWRKMNSSHCLTSANQHWQERRLHCSVLMDGAMENG